MHSKELCLHLNWWSNSFLYSTPLKPVYGLITRHKMWKSSLSTGLDLYFSKERFFQMGLECRIDDSDYHSCKIEMLHLSWNKTREHIILCIRRRDAGLIKTYNGEQLNVVVFKPCSHHINMGSFKCHVYMTAVAIAPLFKRGVPYTITFLRHQVYITTAVASFKG